MKKVLFILFIAGAIKSQAQVNPATAKKILLIVYADSSYDKYTTPKAITEIFAFPKPLPETIRDTFPKLNGNEFLLKAIPDPLNPNKGKIIQVYDPKNKSGFSYNDIRVKEGLAAKSEVVDSDKILSQLKIYKYRNMLRANK